MKNFAKHILWGSVVILGGLFLYMVISEAVGYLPYSDRPGPGWYRGKVSIAAPDLSYISGFILFLGLYLLVWLIIVFLLFRLLRLIGYNRILFAILGGIIIGAVTFYLTLGAGWYIALDGSTVSVGALLGTIYGSTLFPKFLKPPESIGNSKQT